MEHTHDRRDFLKLALGSAAGLGLGAVWRPVLARGSGPSPGDRRDRSADLPPRVVGLRTLGGDFRFDPAGLRLDPGEEVIWLNMGDFHTASAFHPANDDLLGISVPLRIPEGAEPFHSGTLGITGGTEFTYSPDVEGVYDYFCQPHYSFGMVGRFVVGRPRGGPAVTRPLSELNDASRQALPPVASIMGAPGRAFEWASRLNGLLYLRVHGRSGDAAAAVRRGVAADDGLSDLLDEAGRKEAFRRALAAFLDAYAGESGYEELVGLADAAKAPLRAAAAAT